MSPMRPPQLQIRRLGVQPYAETLAAMRDFTASRRADDDDQIWCLQHPPVFTQGQAGRAEHLLDAGDIPVIVSNRGGQVTYHGPGQLVVYVLLDLQRLGLGIRQLVTRLEQAIVATLAGFAIDAFPRADAPGVYVTAAAAPGGWRKIASLGLRVSRGCSYHGLALNVDMDLAPFLRIDPCGQSGLEMTQIADLGGPSGLDEVADRLLPNLVVRLYRERSTGMDD